MSIAEEESTRKYYLLEGPEHGEGLREKLLDAALENRHVIAQREAYVAGRSAEPTEAEIEAAAVVAVNKLHGFYPDSMPCWEDSSEDTQSRAKQYAVYMLEAARKAVRA